MTHYRTARNRREIPTLDGNYSILAGRVYLPVPAWRTQEAISAGAIQGQRGGLYLSLPADTWKPEIEPFLPFIARPFIVPILPDVIPASSWGSSLCNLLTKSSWDELHLPVTAARGNLCQICGEKRGAMECHEIWAFSMPSASEPPEVVGVQRLIGMAAVCSPCHSVFHRGLANKAGKLAQVIGRLSAINEWSRADFDAFHHDSAPQFYARSKRYWMLDVSLIAGLAPLMINSRGSKAWKMDADGLLHSPPRFAGDTAHVTTFLGAPYVYAGREIPATDPAQAVDGLLPEEGDFAFVAQMGCGIEPRA